MLVIAKAVGIIQTTGLQAVDVTDDNISEFLHFIKSLKSSVCSFIKQSSVPHSVFSGAIHTFHIGYIPFEGLRCVLIDFVIS